MRVDTLNIDGDQQSDLTVHGGAENPWAVADCRMTLIHKPDGAGKVTLLATAILSKTSADAVKRYRAWLNGTIFGWGT